jgi:hypothetical protein
MEAPNMKSRGDRITSGILAVLAATVVACGSSQAASGQADPARDGGANYLTADGSYGIGLAPARMNAAYPPQEQDVPEYLRLQLVSVTDGGLA